MLTKNLSFLLFLFLVLLDFFILESSGTSFKGFEDLRWERLTSCQNNEIDGIEPRSEGLKVGVGNSPATCVSHPFDPLSSVIRLHYTYREKSQGTTNPYTLEVHSSTGKMLTKVYVPNSAQSTPLIWNSLQVELKVKNADILRNPVRILIKSSNPLAQPLYLRDRLEFLSSKISPENPKLVQSIKNNVWSIGVSLTGFLLALGLLRRSSNRMYYWLLAGVMILFHFSWKPFFYYDEWHVLQRFSENTFLKSIILTHNEHFLPLFFSWYYLEVKLLSEFYQSYLLISALLFALYGFVISRLLIELGVKGQPARVLGLIFCASSLHVEAMQWAFEQSILLGSIFGILALTNALRYLKTSEQKPLFYSGLQLTISPLFFGGGFVYYPIIIVTILIFLFTGSSISTRCITKKVAILFISLTTCLLVPLSLYLQFKSNSTGHGVNESSFFSDLPRFFSYFFQGVGIGSIIRPLGFYPILSLKSAQEVLAVPLISGLNELRFSIYACSLAILFVFGLYVIIFKLTGELRRLIASFLIGLTFISLFFVLFSAGRWMLGANQSLALRYQVQVLPGLLILIAPLIQALMQWSENRIVLYRFSMGVLCSWLLIQLSAISHFSYFSYNGDVDRLYIESGSQALNSKGEFIGEKPSILPLHIPGITPGTAMPELMRTYHWLRRD